MSIHVRLVLLVYLEMLIFLKSRVQREHHVQRLYQRVVQPRVHGDVQDVAGNPAVVRQRKVDLLTGGRHLCQQLLDLLGPDLHERVDVGHWLGVADGGRLLGLVDVPDRVDPLHDLLGVLLCAFDGVDLGILAPAILLVVVNELQVDFGLV